MKSMRSLITSMLIVLVIAAVIPFTVPVKDGKPLLQFKMPTLGTPKLPDVSLPSLGGEEKRNPEVEVYRWKDANGVWQYSNTPPQGVKYETQTVQADANLIQGLAAQPSASTPVQTPQGDAQPSLIATPGQALKTLDDAKNMDKMIQDHYSAQEKAINAGN